MTVRPSVPLVVYSLGVADAAAALSLPAGGSFAVSLGYAPDPADDLYASGAYPGYVGTRAGAGDALSFRPPADHEVVRLAAAGAAGGLYRWDGSVWRAYASMPQRALRDMRAFDAMDPDGAYAYWASLLGGLQYALTADAASLTRLLDPDAVPDEYLGLLGSMLGVTLSADEPPGVRRRRVREAVPRNRMLGTNAAVASRLYDLGYAGYANEVWADPTDEDNWAALPDAPADVRDDADARGVAARVDPTSGVKGQDWAEVGHATQDAYDALDAGRVPTSRLSVHLNAAPGGAPLADTMSADDVAALKRDVSASLADVLPAQASVRFFATDLGGGDVRYL